MPKNTEISTLELPKNTEISALELLENREISTLELLKNREISALELLENREISTLDLRNSKINGVPVSMLYEHRFNGILTACMEHQIYGKPPHRSFLEQCGGSYHSSLAARIIRPCGSYYFCADLSSDSSLKGSHEVWSIR